ncbi:MAG: RAD55 family ATPase [Thermoplasmatota archaeon]
MERLTTGLAGLDAQLGGGIPPGTVHVLFSEPMNAHELMMYHFAAGGTRLAGGTAFLATDATAEEVTRGVELVGGMPQRVQVVALPIGGRWVLPDAKPGLRVVIDSGSTFLMEAGWDDAFAQLSALKAKMRASGDNLFVAVTSALHTPVEQARLKQWADGVMELGFDRQGFGLYAFLKVTKMRGVADSARLLLFRETEQGLAVESTRRVF